MSNQEKDQLKDELRGIGRQTQWRVFYIVLGGAIPIVWSILSTGATMAVTIRDTVKQNSVDIVTVKESLKENAAHDAKQDETILLLTTKINVK